MVLCGRHFRTVVYNAAASGNLHRIKVFAECQRENPEWIDGCFNDDHTDRYPLVIAARNGHADVVEYMLDMGADPAVRGCVEFDNDNIQGTPPLWAASAAGHLEVVKLLIENAGADINQPTNTHSTPLRGACYDGHLNIVQYLLSKGADPHIPNRHGHTCLMIAAYRNKLPIVNELIATGMDVNIQTERGNSALHDASESGNVGIVRALIEAGARMSKDVQGVDPLICAAQSGSRDVVFYLANHQPSGLRKRDALKLLGSTMLDKNMDAMEAMVVWRQAMEVPLTATELIELKAIETFYEPCKVYDNKTECHYEEELDAIEGSIEGQRMQSLLIRERVLGGAHSDVHYYLRYRGAVCCDLGAMDKCYEFWKHAFELQQKHFPPLYSAAITTLVSFQETFTMTLNDYVINQNPQREGNQNLRVKSHWVQFVFTKVCEELERVEQWGGKPLLEETECCGRDRCLHATEEEELKRLVLVAIQLINIRDRLSLPSANVAEIHDVREFDLCIPRMVDVCEKLRIPLLHYALEEKESDSFDVLALPRLVVLEELLTQNLDVNAVDKNGDTALHIVLRAAEFRKSLVRALFSRGADPYMRNADGEVLLDMMRKMEADGSRAVNFENISIGANITLTAITANAMRVKHSRFFEGVERCLPPIFRKFYLTH